MTVHTLRPAKIKPHEGIIELLETLLAFAKAGDIQEIATAWGMQEQEFTACYATDRIWLGGVTYGLAHELMTGDRE